MKNQESNKKVSNENKCAAMLFSALICGTLLINAGCKKTEARQASEINKLQLNAQEQTLLGRWELKKSEMYEITGVDSIGQYLSTLIASSVCDSNCSIVFSNEYCRPQYSQKLKGFGSIGDCNPNAFFGWRAKQPKKLEIGNGNFYDILYLCSDSAAFSTVYTKDILTLRSVVHYKRN